MNVPFITVLKGLENYEYSGIWVCIRDCFIPIKEADAESFDLDKLVTMMDIFVMATNMSMKNTIGMEEQSNCFMLSRMVQVDLEEQVFWGESYEEYVHPEDREMEEEE